MFVDSKKFNQVLSQSLAYRLLLILCSSLVLALMTQLKLSLFFTPVPVTGQTFAVLMISYLLGPRHGFYSVCFYLLLGICGLPFFSSGGSGFLYLKGATGGYLIGFLFSSLLVGYFSKKSLFKNFFSSCVLFAVGLVPTFVCGLIWLGFLLGFQNVLHLGFYPFIPGEILKVLICAGVVSLSLSFFDHEG